MVGSLSSRPRSSRLSLRSRDVRTDSTDTDSPLSNRNSRPIEDKVEGRRSVIQQRLSTLNAITEEEPDSGSPRTRSAPPPRRSVLIPPTNVNGLTPPRFRDQRTVVSEFISGTLLHCITISVVHCHQSRLDHRNAMLPGIPGINES